MSQDSSKFIVGADFSQLELRIIAIVTGDESLLNWYNEGRDVHTLTAGQTLFNKPLEKVTKLERDVAKMVEFAFSYNVSADVTTAWRAAVLKFPFITVTNMQRFRKLWFRGHPQIRTWQLETIKQAEKNHFVEAPLSGRRRYFHDGHIDPNEALNFAVQATAADLCNRAILKLDKLLNWPVERIIAQVHDAIYVEGPDPFRLYRLLKQCMEQTVTLNNHTMLFPVDVGIGKNWKDTNNKVVVPDWLSFEDFLSSLQSWSVAALAAQLQNRSSP